MILTLGEFRVLLANDFLFKTGSSHYGYDFEYMLDLVNAITAYMINRSFEYSERIKFGFDNLTHFYNNKADEKIDRELYAQRKDFNNCECKEDTIESSELEDSIENDRINKFRKLQRLELSSRKNEKMLIDYRESLNINAKSVSYMKTTNEGRIYDCATLEKFYWRLNLDKEYNLIDHIVNDRVKDEKKFPAKDFVQAYKLYDDLYDEAKNTTDKVDYIFKWIALYRLEMVYHLSLIPKIADHILTIDKDIDFILKKLPDIWGVRYFDSGDVSEPISVIRHEKEIKLVFSFEKDELKEYIYHMNIERAKIVNLVFRVLPAFKFLFDDFIEGEESAVNEIYNFCHDEYPIIESHVSSDFYRKDRPSRLDRDKIRITRKIIKYLLEPAELKKITEKD